MNAIYPISIVLMIMGLCDRWLYRYPYVYPIVIYTVLIESIVSSLESVGLKLGILTEIFHVLPLYDLGLGWVILVPAAMLAAIGFQAGKS